VVRTLSRVTASIRLAAMRRTAGGWHNTAMPPFVYRCPNTGLNVQGFSAEEVPADDESFETLTCLACRQVHLVNPTTGRVLGSDDE
jgi:hypothetical protein